MIRRNKRLRGRVSVEIQDSRPWDLAIVSLRKQLEPALKRQLDHGNSSEYLEGAEVLLLSPNGESPLRALVEMTVNGDTWREIQDIAAMTLEEATASATDWAGSPSGLEGPTRTYEEQGTELVPA